MFSKYTLDRFFSKVNIPSNTMNCWTWTAATNNGYGRFRYNGLNYLAHRFSYRHFYGQLDTEQIVHHECENTRCVNPLHLDAITKLKHHLLHAENMRCINGHEYSEENCSIRVIKYRTYIKCNICGALSQ